MINVPIPKYCFLTLCLYPGTLWFIDFITLCWYCLLVLFVRVLIALICPSVFCFLIAYCTICSGEVLKSYCVRGVHVLASPALLQSSMLGAVPLINVHCRKSNKQVNEMNEMDRVFIPGSLFAEVGVSCWDCLPAWALVEYVSSVESREATDTKDKSSSPTDITKDVKFVCRIWPLLERWAGSGVVLWNHWWMEQTHIQPLTLSGEQGGNGYHYTTPAPGSNPHTPTQRADTLPLSNWASGEIVMDTLRAVPDARLKVRPFTELWIGENQFNIDPTRGSCLINPFAETNTA